MHRFQTTAVHAGRDDFGDLCVHAPPLDLSTTYPIADLDVGSASFDALVGGQASAANPIYARLHNPTVARTENAIAALEGTQACVAYASGNTRESGSAYRAHTQWMTWHLEYK